MKLLRPAYPEARLSLLELQRRSRGARDAGMELSALLSWRIYSLLGMPFLKIALWIGMTPNQVTWLSVVLGLVASGLLAAGGYAFALVAVLLLQVMVALDYADGALARLTGRASMSGLYLSLVAFDIVGPILLFALGWRAFLLEGVSWYALAGFGGGVAYLFNRHIYTSKILTVLIGDKARVGRALSTNGARPATADPAPPPPSPRSLRRLAVFLFNLPWPMRVLVNVVMVGAVFDRLAWVALLYGIGYPLAVIVALRREVRSNFEWVYRWAGETQP